MKDPSTSTHLVFDIIVASIHTIYILCLTKNDASIGKEKNGWLSVHYNLLRPSIIDQRVVRDWALKINPWYALRKDNERHVHFVLILPLKYPLWWTIYQNWEICRLKHIA